MNLLDVRAAQDEAQIARARRMAANVARRDRDRMLTRFRETGDERYRAAAIDAQNTLEAIGALEIRERKLNEQIAELGELRAAVAAAAQKCGHATRLRRALQELS